METLTNQVRGALPDSTISDVIAKLSSEVDGSKRELAKMDDSTSQLLRLEVEISELTSRQDDRTNTGKETEDGARYIINPITRKCHRALIHGGLPKFLKTR